MGYRVKVEAIGPEYENLRFVGTSDGGVNVTGDYIEENSRKVPFINSIIDREQNK